MTLRVLISGAGIAGPTLAYWLHRYGFQPTLVEAAPALRTGGYMIDFWGLGYDVAERMQLLDSLRRDAYMMKEVRIVGGDGERVAWFDADTFSAASNGRFFSIPRGDLAEHIYQLLPADVERVFDDSVSGLVQHNRGVQVEFASGGSRRFDLVIGADGLHSAIRRLAISQRAPRYLGYNVAAYTARDYPHVDEDVYVAYSTPGAQVARYGLRDGRTTFFFILAADEPFVGDGGAQRAMLRRRFAGAGWECAEILARIDDAQDFYFDQVAQIELESWSHGRVSLVGDAAYCPSLLAGQGSSFAMAGAYLLAWHLATHPDDWTAGLREYERSFHSFVAEKQRAARRFAPWFAPKTAFGLRVRNALTNAIRLPVIGAFFAGRSLGDQLELPGTPPAHK